MREIESPPDEVHRAHASTAGVAALLPSAAGLLLAKEIYFLSKAIENPERPFIAILGGAKVSEKIAVIDNLLEKVNAIVIGGAMAYTFLKTQGISTGKSRVEEDKIDFEVLVADLDRILRADEAEVAAKLGDKSAKVTQEPRVQILLAVVVGERQELEAVGIF